MRLRISKRESYAQALYPEWFFYDYILQHFSTLRQKHCNKKQEIEECGLKLSGYIYNQGTYTPQADTEKSAGIFTVNRC